MKKLNRRGFLKMSALWGVAPIAAKFLKLDLEEKTPEPEPVSEPESDGDMELEYGYQSYECDGRTFEVGGTLSGYTALPYIPYCWDGKTLPEGFDPYLGAAAIIRGFIVEPSAKRTVWK